jgi:diacylglycerol kinase (ATP)
MPAVEFIINGSLARANRRFLSLCRDAARRAGWRCELAVTGTALAGAAAARAAAARGADLVVAAGGDGTVRSCAEGLAGSPVPLGIVPLGTANLLARTLGIRQHPHAALACALAAPGGRERGTADRRIDLAVADGTVFTAMAGMGLDAAVVSAARFKHHLGWLSYAISGAAHLASPPASFTVRLDGRAPITRQARSVVVGNSGLLPGGFTLLPDARVDDGLLDVAILAPHGPFGWPAVAARVLSGGHGGDGHLELLRASEVEITADRVLPREADGDLVGPAGGLSVSVRRAWLTVRVPAHGPHGRL